MPLLGYAETPNMVANAAPFGALPPEANPFGQNLLFALYSTGAVTPAIPHQYGYGPSDVHRRPYQSDCAQL